LVLRCSTIPRRRVTVWVRNPVGHRCREPEGRGDRTFEIDEAINFTVFGVDLWND
jgi:hypothetical protein